MLDKARYPWLWLAIKQAELFVENNIAYTTCLVTGDSPRYIMNHAYCCLVNSNHLMALELLPKDEKENVWETAKEIAAGRLNKAKTVELSKALYCLEYILNLKEWNGMPIN
jgi:hypothetical protein